MSNKDEAFETKLSEAGFLARPAGTDEISVQIDGVDADDEQLAQLLEQAAKFIRAAGGQRVGAQPFQEVTTRFQSLDLQNHISLKHRS